MDESVTHHVRKGKERNREQGRELSSVIHAFHLTVGGLPQRPAHAAGPMQDKPCQ